MRQVKRDPAPSRWSYRIQRLWLTPLIRQLLRVGVPFSAALGMGALVFSDEDNRQIFQEKIEEIRRSVAERPEFMVEMMAIDGASEELSQDIREVLPVDFPQSSFDLDLVQMKAIVEELDSVGAVEMHIRSGGVLQLEVSERVPAVVWRHRGILELLDADGRRVKAITNRMARADLPLIVGEGADRAVAEALAVFDAAAPLEGRLRGLVRMGERRWDLALDRDQRVMLPENAPVQAVEQVIALSQAQDLLARDVVAVDWRNTRRPTLRMAPAAVEEMRQIKVLEVGGQ